MLSTGRLTILWPLESPKDPKLKPTYLKITIDYLNKERKNGFKQTKQKGKKEKVQVILLV